MSTGGRLSLADLELTLRDGVPIALDLTVLDDGQRHPVLLMRTPYFRVSSRMAHDPVGLARDGWAVVICDVRGRGDSAGQFTPFTQERADGADVVAWCAAQPWSTGQVVTTGMSYCGGTQWLAALEAPPALAAINPVISGGPDTGSWLYEGGAFLLGLAVPWALQLAASEPGLSSAALAERGRLAGEWERILTLPLGNDPIGAVFPAYAGWLAGAAADRVSTLDCSSIVTPVFAVAGWFDVFCESAIAAYVGMSAGAGSPRARRLQRLVIGPWTHGGNLSNLHAEFDFGGIANGGMADVGGGGLRWLRDAMSGSDDNLATGVLCFVMGSNRWQEFSAWPPVSGPLTFALSSGPLGANSLRGDGLLAPVAEVEPEGVDSLAHDPVNPVPTRGGRILGPYLPLAGPVDQRPVEERDDVLVFTSEPFLDDLTFVGMVTAELLMSSSAPAFDVCVKLVDVHPDGRAFNVVDSIRRLPAGRAGEPRPVLVEVGSTAHTVLAGHRLRVEVAGSNFPRFDRDPCTGEAPVSAHAFAPAVHSLHWGGDAGSRIVLPVLVQGRTATG